MYTIFTYRFQLETVTVELLVKIYVYIWATELFVNDTKYEDSKHHKRMVADDDQEVVALIVLPQSCDVAMAKQQHILEADMAQQREQQVVMEVTMEEEMPSEVEAAELFDPSMLLHFLVHVHVAQLQKKCRYFLKQLKFVKFLNISGT